MSICRRWLRLLVYRWNSQEPEEYNTDLHQGELIDHKTDHRWIFVGSNDTTNQLRSGRKGLSADISKWAVVFQTS